MCQQSATPIGAAWPRTSGQAFIHGLRLRYATHVTLWPEKMDAIAGSVQ
jgi:hypothetical protein